MTCVLLLTPQCCGGSWCPQGRQLVFRLAGDGQFPPHGPAEGRVGVPQAGPPFQSGPRHVFPVRPGATTQRGPAPPCCLLKSHPHPDRCVSPPYLQQSR